MFTVFIRITLQAIARFPYIGVGMGGIVAAVCAYFFWSCVQQVREYSSGPLELRIEEALGRNPEKEIFVRLSDMKTQGCSNALRLTDMDDRYVYIPLHSTAQGQADLVALYESADHCTELEGRPIEGTIYKMYSRLQDRLKGGGMKLAPEVRAFCTNCGLADSKIGLWVTGVMFLVGLGLMPLSFRLQKQAVAQLKSKV